MSARARPRRARLWALAALGLVACGSPPPDEPASAPPAGPGLGPLDDLARRFGRLRRRMESRGYADGEFATRTFALEGEGVALPVDVPVGVCTTWVALGGGGLRDLRMTVFDGDGREVAVDGRRGEGALAHVCPPSLPDRPASAPHYLELRALEGSGAIVVGSFRSRPAEGEGFTGLFEEVVAPPVPYEAVEAALTEAREAFRERGLRVDGEPAFRRMVEGQGWRRPLPLVAGRCHVVVARGGEGVEDVDLYLYDARGAEVARDLGADAAPRIEHCAREDGEATLEVRAFAGGGAVGVMALSGPLEVQAEAEAPPELEELEPLEALEATLAELASRGLGEPRFLVEDAAIQPGEVRQHEVVLGPGCALIAGAGGPGELDLDLYLSDAEGVVDRDTRVHRSARVAACVEGPSTLRLTVKAYGRGRYALAQLDVPGVLGLAELRLRTLVDAEEAALGPPRRILLRRGEPIQEPVPPGECVAVAVAGDAAVQDVDLLLRAGETLLASDTGPAPWARLRHCRAEEGEDEAEGEAPPAEPPVLKIVANRGEGEVLLQWLAPR